MASAIKKVLTNKLRQQFPNNQTKAPAEILAGKWTTAVARTHTHIYLYSYVQYPHSDRLTGQTGGQAGRQADNKIELKTLNIN